MKKFAYLVVLATAVTFTSCFLENSKKDNEEQHEQQVVDTPEEPTQEPVIVETPKPRETPEIIKDFKASFEVELARSTLGCQGSEINGNDIIFTIEVDESKMRGKSMKEVFRETGNSTDLIAQSMVAQIQPENKDEEAQLVALRAYEYNLVFRFVGSRTKEEIICTITPDMLPL